MTERKHRSVVFDKVLLKESPVENEWLMLFSGVVLFKIALYLPPPRLAPRCCLFETGGLVSGTPHFENTLEGEERPPQANQRLNPVRSVPFHVFDVDLG